MRKKTKIDVLKLSVCLLFCYCRSKNRVYCLSLPLVDLNTLFNKVYSPSQRNSCQYSYIRISLFIIFMVKNITCFGSDSHLFTNQRTYFVFLLAALPATLKQTSVFVFFLQRSCLNQPWTIYPVLFPLVLITLLGLLSVFYFYFCLCNSVQSIADLSYGKSRKLCKYIADTIRVENKSLNYNELGYFQAF